MTWQKVLLEEFPGALPWPELLERTNNRLGTHGFTPENTLFGNVVCRDEINKNDMDAFAQYWGENFDLAGLGGFPAAGLTGFGAYQHHVPDGGNLFILYGPHIGISSDGELGKLERPGMHLKSTACGALLGLLNKARANPDYLPELNPLDPEQFLIEQGLQSTLAEIVHSAKPIKAITVHMYDLIETTLLNILSQLDFSGQTVLLGGVMINTPLASPDHFLPRKATIQNIQDNPGETLSWLDSLLG